MMTKLNGLIWLLGGIFLINRGMSVEGFICATAGSIIMALAEIIHALERMK